jgi:hypothetical protein
MGSIRLARNKSVRRRRDAARRVKWRVKAYLWRITAVWCWLHIASLVFLRRDIFAHLELLLFEGVHRTASLLGFEPGNIRLLPALLKTFWVLCITNFSWPELLGLLIYVALAPLILPVLTFFPKVRKQYESKKVEVVGQRGLFQTGFRLKLSLVAGLVAWFALYGGSSAKPPLMAALVLTGWLFAIRLARALPYTAIVGIGLDGPLDRVVHAAHQYLLNVIKQLLSGKMTDENLKYSVKVQRWVLRKLRWISVYLYGGAAERRASILVLIRYVLDMSLLASLLILFWAIAIRLLSVPNFVGNSDAIMVSASHVIPGLAEPPGVKLSRVLELGIPFSAWIMFVLYIGPLASMFPAYQERYLKQIRIHYDNLRTVRGLLRRLSDSMQAVLDRTGQSTAIPPQLVGGEATKSFPSTTPP